MPTDQISLHRYFFLPFCRRIEHHLDYDTRVERKVKQLDSKKTLKLRVELQSSLHAWRKAEKTFSRLEDVLETIQYIHN